MYKYIWRVQREISCCHILAYFEKIGGNVSWGYALSYNGTRQCKNSPSQTLNSEVKLWAQLKNACLEIFFFSTCSKLIKCDISCFPLSPVICISIWSWIFASFYDYLKIVLNWTSQNLLIKLNKLHGIFAFLKLGKALVIHGNFVLCSFQRYQPDHKTTD